MLLSKNECGQVHQKKLLQGISVLEVAHNNAKAKISLYGGQVLSWQPTGEKDVFWLSKTSDFEQGKAIRGGIPLCWPWFGSHPNDVENKMGNHGFARTQQWQVDNIEISEEGIEICLYWQGVNMSDLWPFSSELKQVIFIGQSFKQVLQMTNLSDQDAYYTGALHSYFSVSSPTTIKMTALDQAPFYDKLTDQLHEPQSLESFSGPVDRIYDTNQIVKIIDAQWQRTIELNASNTNQWVFWNPGTELANAMADVHTHGEEEFVCLEAANTQMQRLAAGQTATMEQVISIGHE
jgi:glucose-6-phosphate 1-epimerase